MSIINSQPLIGASGQGGYFLTKSLRFRSSASAYLSRTFSTGNRRTWTWSAWVKRGALGSQVFLFANYNATVGGAAGIRFETDDTLLFYNFVGAYQVQRATTQVFRDPSAWYHIVAVLDTTQATAADRAKLYINGVQVTAFSATANPTQNYDGVINYNDQHEIAAIVVSGSGSFFDGYMAEVNFIDGQALTPSSFGQTDSATGVWQPAKYTGTYGTNGFYLPFTDVATTSGSNAGLGKDFSGNGNYWTTNNISVTSGSTYDSMKDVPTLTDTDTANYCTWNPLDKGTVTVTNGNLSAVSAADAHAIRATMGLPLSGKFYWETTVSGLGYGSSLGIANATSNLTTGASSAETRTFQWGSWFNSFNSGIVQYGTNQTLTGGTNWSGASQLATNDVLMIAVDMDNGSMWVGKNGTWFNSSGTANPATNTDPRWTGLGGTTWFAYYSGYGSVSPVTANINFGQQPFAYTPPTGFKALNTFNLPTPTIGATASTVANKYFDINLWTGNSSARSFTNSGSMQPDFVWVKDRTTAGIWNVLFDSVRGAGNQLSSNETDAELASASSIAGKVSAFNSDGFSVVTGSSSYYSVNQTGDSYVGWQWRANGTAVTNTAGSITSTVSANTTAGFSIVTYTGTGASATVGHGLGVAPSMIIIKKRSSTGPWEIYHSALGNGQVIYLNTTGAAIAASDWQNTTPTSSVWSMSNSPDINGSGATYVAYCFAQVAGYSAFGSYTGNGSTDGTFIYLGFRPKFFMIKDASSGTLNWYMWDSARNIYNVIGEELYPSLSNAGSTNTDMDFLSNGIKLRNSGGGVNNSGDTFIYAAFAESPFKYSLAR